MGPACVSCGWVEQKHAGMWEGCGCSEAEILDAMIRTGQHMAEEG